MEKVGLTFEGTRYWMSPDAPVVWYAIDRADSGELPHPRRDRVSLVVWQCGYEADREHAVGEPVRIERATLGADNLPGSR